jgi:hypothetical protein
MELTQEQIEFLDKVCNNGNKTTNEKSFYYDYDENGVNAFGVDMRDMNLTKIPIKFNVVYGYFYCGENKLTSLENCPDVVYGSFWANNNNLTSLDYSPKHIGTGRFYIENNPLRNYFKNIKEEDFKLWGSLDWRCVIVGNSPIIQEYPFLITIAKNYVNKETFIDLIEKYPETKLYLK